MKRGWLGRTVRPSPPGCSLIEPLNAMCAWAENHWDELLDAREA
ncbi:hypothetical protein [Microbispora sp. NPDC046933]